MPSRRKSKRQSLPQQLIRGKGDWTFELFTPSEGGAETFEWTDVDESGEIVVRSGTFFRREVVTVKNLVVNTGLNWMRKRLFDSLSDSGLIDQMQFIAIGTGSTAVAATDTTLQTESARDEVDTYSEGGTGVVTLSTTFSAGVGTGTITEAGLFDASSSGTMFARTVFSGVAKGAGDILKVSATFTFTSV